MNFNRKVLKNAILFFLNNYIGVDVKLLREIKREIIKIIITYIKNSYYKRQKKCLVLYYHRICKIDRDLHSLAVTPENFENQIKYLKERFDLISLSELISQLKNKRIKRNSVAITFDDGYNDNLHYAKPILEKYNIPATIFVSPGMVGSKKEFWWDELERILFTNSSDIYKVQKIKIQGREYSWNIKNYGYLKRVYYGLHHLLKNMPEAERTKNLEEIRKWNSLSENGRRMHMPLTREELKELSSSSLIEIGSHTMTHPCLSYESLETQKYQIMKSKEVLEDIIGYEVKSFSYPFGTSSDINQDTIRLTKKAGFKAGFTADRGLVYKNCKLYKIPRYHALNWNLNEFQNSINRYFLVNDIFYVIRTIFGSIIKFKSDKKAEKYFKEKVLFTPKDELKNILQFNTNDFLGGAPKVSYNLHRKYKSMNYNSKILVRNSYTNDENVRELLKNNSGGQKLSNNLKKQNKIFDFLNISSFNIINTEEFKHADVLHLHLLHGNGFNLFKLPQISSLKPVIWTLHDMWAFTGRCAHSFYCNRWQKGCRNCPQFSMYNSIKKNTTDLSWNFKKRIYNNSKLTIVCPSMWLKEKVKKSILNKFDIRLIYNGVDDKKFYKKDKLKARDYLNLPKNKKILMFCASGGKNNLLKGGQYLEKIFKSFKTDKKIIFVIVGGGKYQKNANLINTGYIKEEEILSFYYSASDLFIYPSLADTFPLVVLESMACGTPVITFKTGGIPEMVEHNETGFIAEYQNISEFINGINIFLNDENKLKDASIKSVYKIKSRFLLDNMVEQYINLYNEKAVR